MLIHEQISQLWQRQPTLTRPRLHTRLQGPHPSGILARRPFSPYRQHEAPWAVLIADRNEGTFITLVIRTLFNANL